MGGQRLRRRHFDPEAEGLRFHNGTTGNLTGYCVADTVGFMAHCLLPVRCKRVGGTGAFNGGGLVGQCTINVLDVGSRLPDRPPLRPYNAPFHAQIRGNSWCTVLIDANTVSLSSAMSGGAVIYRKASRSFPPRQPLAGSALLLQRRDPGMRRMP